MHYRHCMDIVNLFTMRFRGTVNYAQTAMLKITDSRETFHKSFILFLVFAASILFIFMVRNFLIAILLAAIFSGLLYPLYCRLLALSWLENHPALTSALLLAISFIVIGIPLAVLLGVVTREAMQISENVVPWIEQNLMPKMSLSEQLPDWVPFASLLDPYKQSIIGALGQTTSAVGSFLVKSGSALTQGTATLLLNLFIMLYAMFFFLLRGSEWLVILASYLPLTPEDCEELIRRGLAVTRASLKGILGIGLLQGFLIGLAFLVIGLEGAAFWGTIVVVLSAIPLVGPPLVWLPAALYLFLTGQTGWAIGLIIWGAFVVGTVDNILRPRIVSAEAKIPDLLILLSTLGGIIMFGAIGIIIGPIVTAALITILDIYRHTFVKNLPGQ